MGNYDSEQFWPERLRKQRGLPSIPRMAANLAKSAARVATGAVRGRPVERSAEEQAAVTAICEGCEFFRQADRRCSKCGCGLSGRLLNKIRYAALHCPVGKW